MQGPLPSQWDWTSHCPLLSPQQRLHHIHAPGTVTNVTVFSYLAYPHTFPVERRLRPSPFTESEALVSCHLLRKALNIPPHPSLFFCVAPLTPVLCLCCGLHSPLEISSAWSRTGAH